MITKDQAIALGNKCYGDLHYGSCKKHIGPRGGVKIFIITWRVNGRCKTWKTQPNRFTLPIKYGLYEYGYLTERNAHEFHLADACPLNLDVIHS